MKTKFLFIIMVSLASLTVEKANACTTFVINDSTHLIFGRNFDFDFGEGYICLNRRGLKKTSFVREPDLPVRWTARYGSITFNQVGIDNPMGGMNEKGLVIAQMALPGSVFPESNGKEVLGELDWIQFQLDNSASLNEVIENNTTV
jgi:choloylglycine hydrolase